MINGFATNFSEAIEKPEISPTKAAKLKAMGEKFQKEGEEMLKNMKEYVKHGKFTGSEESNSTDEECMDHRSSHKYLRSRESPLDVIRQQVLGHSSHQEENGLLHEPSARIPEGASESFSSQRFSLEKAFSNEKSEKEQLYTSRKPASSSDENSGRVRFLSSRLPATGSGMRAGFHSMPSTSPEATNLKPILKKKSPNHIHQGSGSSSETDNLRQERLMDRDDSGVSCSEIPDLSSNGEISLQEIKRKEHSPSTSSISVDTLFGNRNNTLHSVSENGNFSRRTVQQIEPLTETNAVALRDERDPQRILSSIEALREASERGYTCMSTSDLTAEAVRTCEPLIADKTPEIVHRYECSPMQSISSLHVAEGRTVRERSPPISQLLQASSSSSGKSPLPSEMLNLSLQSSGSSLHSSSGKKLSFSDGVVVCTEGAPAPKPITSLEFCPFAHYLLRLDISSPNLLQAHAWPAVLRGRDVVGICQANDAQILAYLLPIIYQLIEEREVYADLPKSSSGVSGCKCMKCIPGGSLDSE